MPVWSRKRPIGRMVGIVIIIAAVLATSSAQAHQFQRSTGELTGKKDRVRAQTGLRRFIPRRIKLPSFRRTTQKTSSGLRSTLGALNQRLKRSCVGACQAVGQFRHRNMERVRGATRKIGNAARKTRETAGKVGRGVVGGVKKAGKWAKAHPKQALGITLGAAAMFGVVFCAAPALSATVAGALAPTMGQTTAGVIGTAAGGALACGSRSLLVHATPMVTGVDPFNAKQLATDVGMSSTFGFFGFAQAAMLKNFTGLTGATGLGLFAANYVGLVGYELFKDYMQNRIRNRVANDPKRFRDIWFKSLMMESASNIHRCIPGLGLETNFGAKIVGDLGGTVWWDRIVNKRNPTAKNKAKRAPPRTDPTHDALTE